MGGLLGVFCEENGTPYTAVFFHESAPHDFSYFALINQFSQLRRLYTERFELIISVWQCSQLTCPLLIRLSKMLTLLCPFMRHL